MVEGAELCVDWVIVVDVDDIVNVADEVGVDNIGDTDDGDGSRDIVLVEVLLDSESSVLIPPISFVLFD